MRPPHRWLELEPTGEDPRLDGWCHPLRRRLLEGAASMRAILGWALDEEQLPIDPRFLVAWMQAQGQARWHPHKGTWHLTSAGREAFERADNLLGLIDRDPGLTEPERAVARALALRGDGQRSYAELAEAARLTRRQVRYALARLAKRRGGVRVMVRATVVEGGQRPHFLRLVAEKTNGVAGDKMHLHARRKHNGRAARSSATVRTEMEKQRERLAAAIARRVAVEAHVDPRTVQRVWLGHQVRGDAGERARAALARMVDDEGRLRETAAA